MIWFLVLVLFPLVLASLVTFDYLVRLEYAKYRRQWEADGRPPGYLWSPKKAGDRHLWPTHHGCMLRWTVSTPDWIKGDPLARKLHTRLRALSVVYLVAWLLFVLLVFTRGSDVDRGRAGDAARAGVWAAK